MQKPSKAEAIMYRHGLERVRMMVDEDDAQALADEPRDKPCEYYHFDCSRVEHGACFDELMGIFENHKNGTPAAKETE
jgi:hypothetical protein